MIDETTIRKIARSNYWQNIYKSCKECSEISLFDNKSNLSGLQGLFLHWLAVYAMLYTELRDRDWDKLDYDVIDDDVRTDAFLYYRGLEIKKIIRQNKLEKEKGRIKSKGKHKGNVTPFSVDMIRG